MKTEDLITLALVGVIGYVAYQKYGSKNPTPDFGLANPNDPNWGDAPATAAPASASVLRQGFVDQLITQAADGAIL